MSKLFSIHEVALAWGLCDDTVRDLIREKKLKAVQIGNRYKVSQEALDEFLAAASTEAK